MPKKTFCFLGLVVVFGLLSVFVLKTEKVFAFPKEVNPVRESEFSNRVNVYFFWGEGCPHCAEEKPFLEKLKQRYSQVKVYDFEIYRNSENRKLLTEVGKELNANVSGIPFTVIGEKYFTGWYDEEVSGLAIEKAVKEVLEKEYLDVVGEIIGSEKKPAFAEASAGRDKIDKEEYKDEEKSVIPQKIKIPILGEIETKNVSLPLLSVLLGGLDGFNPCAMWTLLFLISLLLGMKDRKRMWILGIAFLMSSAAVYFLFMTAWLNLLLFVGFIIWVRVIIGLVALGSGVYNLREYFVNKESGCKVIGDEKKQKFFEKLKAITQKQHFWLALLGIIILAGAVNLVELICSVGLPVVFTQILSLSDLAKWQSYLYMLIYIFVFMLDDLVVFFAAMLTLRITGITTKTKYGRFSCLIGGILMAIIGILLIFKPAWLMFG